ncbi:DNAJ heat shock N-terminal domain-containing [Chlorella sorokiniana]|uniref:DNAJ heat shock N-terminal domain-containing n=1 Tax=Chlorella sorokiniana TaxID=3076 RepID=A0A2P6U4N2_CHLSO|nr:DNAJ heat shock N-terminal domain-containing [Chlorella sorokiniana]|eukprot:PRW61266.1 DNAJ heat shock N-terminal domain-containing [Chlorella sorokiniana]
MTTWQELKSQAELSFKSGDFNEAANGYTAALEALRRHGGSVEDQAKIIANRCAALQRIGDWNQAVADAKEACDLAPKWEKAYYRLGTALLGRGGCGAEAMAAFERGLALKPGNKQLKEGRQKAEAEVLGGAENSAPVAAEAAKGEGAGAGAGGGVPPLTPEASGEAATAASPPPTPSPAPDSPRHLAEAQKALGNAAFKSGRYDEAVRCFTAALQLCPGTAVYLGNRAAAHLMARHYPDAISDSLAAVELDAGFVKGYARAAKAEMLMGQFEAAEALYRQGMERDASLQQDLIACQIVARKVRAGQEALAAGEADRALVLAEAACEGSVPAAEAAVRLRVEALLHLGRHAEAVAEARNMTLGGDAQAPEVLALRSQALYLCGNMQMAQQLYQQALRRDPDCLPAQRGLKRLRSVLAGKERGNECFSRGAFQEAYEHYSASLGADPQLRTAFMAQVVCNRAAAAAKLGRHEDALADAEQAIKLNASYAKAYVRRAQAHLELKNFDAAVMDFNKVAELDDSYPGLREMLREAKLAKKKALRVDYYAVLGVSQDADDDEVKRAYRKAALKTHPDKATEENREEASKQFKLVGQAFAVLSDPAQRRRYDAGWSLEEINQGYSEDDMGGSFGRGGFGGFGGMDEDDLFAQMFAGGGGRRYSGGFGGGYGGGAGPRGGGFPGGYPGSAFGGFY